MKLVRLSDEIAVELGINNLAKRWEPFTWFGWYDRRRVKRARRAALRHGFTRNGEI